MTFSWHPARVTALDGDRVRLNFQPLRHCQRCLRGEGCGAGVFSRLFYAGPSELWIAAPEGLRIGQMVRVSIDERDLVRAAAWLYGLPLITFILAASAAATFLHEAWLRDLGALLIGLLVAGTAAILAGRWRGRILNPRVELLSSDARLGPGDQCARRVA